MSGASDTVVYMRGARARVWRGQKREGVIVLRGEGEIKTHE